MLRLPSMQTRLAACVALLVAGACLVYVGAGCKPGKAPETTEMLDNHLKLPGATNVVAALEQKDYDGALVALIRVKEGVSSAEQLGDFMVLSRHVRDKLMEVSATDAKAAEALTTLRSMTTGR